MPPHQTTLRERGETRIAIALGSNVGDRAAHLAAGRAALAARGVAWRATSEIFETEPVGPVADQPPFLNQVAVGETDLTPRALLNTCLEIERAQGRVRTMHWGPRTLDLDILLYGEQTVAEPDLTIPHPELARRAFVLIPLAEVAPAWTLPGDGRTVQELLTALPRQGGVRVWRSSATKRPM